MSEKKIIRKVISKSSPEEPKEEKKTEEPAEIDSQRGIRAKKECYFCQGKATPSYTDIVILRKFLTDRSKIVAKLRSGLCSKHQRGVTRQIKYARHLSLLPFIPKV